MRKARPRTSQQGRSKTGLAVSQESLRRGLRSCELRAPDPRQTLICTASSSAVSTTASQKSDSLESKRLCSPYEHNWVSPLGCRAHLLTPRQLR